MPNKNAARPKRPSKRQLLTAFLQQRGAALVDEALAAEIASHLAPVSPAYLRKLLRSSGVPLAPLVEGVRQDSFDELERTLLALERVYAAASAAGDRPRMKLCRAAVIEAKKHARFRPSSPVRDEMIQWMLVWLENPPLFPLWLKLRRARCDWS